MYNDTIQLEVIDISPYSKKKGSELNEGFILTGRVETKKSNFFDDVDLGAKKAGLETILRGDLPIKGTSVKLNFVKKKDLRVDCETLKDLPVELKELMTGPVKKGLTIVQMKLDIKKLNEEIAGKLVSKLGSTLTLSIKTTQEDLKFQASKN